MTTIDVVHLLIRAIPLPQVLRGRDADTGVPEPGDDHRGAVPDAAADEGVREHVGRRGVGDAGRAREDGLVAGALHGLLQGARSDRVRVAGRSGVRQVQRRMDEPGAGRHGAGPTPAGAEELHDLRLLHRPLEVPAGCPARVRGRQVGVDAVV